MSNYDYADYRKSSITNKINEEILFYENSEYNADYPIDEYVIYLKNRIGVNKYEPLKPVHYDMHGNRHEIKKMNLDEYSKDMDIIVFKKPWNKLKEFHKIMKIKEYVDSLEYKENKKNRKTKISNNREFLKEELCSGLKDKKFGKGKSEIVYDEENMLITSMSPIKYDRKSNLYKIKWN